MSPTAAAAAAAGAAGAAAAAGPEAGFSLALAGGRQGTVGAAEAAPAAGRKPFSGALPAALACAASCAASSLPGASPAGWAPAIWPRFPLRWRLAPLLFLPSLSAARTFIGSTRPAPGTRDFAKIGEFCFSAAGREFGFLDTQIVVAAPGHRLAVVDETDADEIRADGGLPWMAPRRDDALRPLVGDAERLFLDEVHALEREVGKGGPKRTLFDAEVRRERGGAAAVGGGAAAAGGGAAAANDVDAAVAAGGGGPPADVDAADAAVAAPSDGSAADGSAADGSAADGAEATPAAAAAGDDFASAPASAVTAAAVGVHSRERGAERSGAAFAGRGGAERAAGRAAAGRAATVRGHAGAGGAGGAGGGWAAGEAGGFASAPSRDFPVVVRSASHPYSPAPLSKCDALLSRAQVVEKSLALHGGVSAYTLGMRVSPAVAGRRVGVYVLRCGAAAAPDAFYVVAMRSAGGARPHFSCEERPFARAAGLQAFLAALLAAALARAVARRTSPPLSPLRKTAAAGGFAALALPPLNTAGYAWNGRVFLPLVLVQGFAEIVATVGALAVVTENVGAGGGGAGAGGAGSSPFSRKAGEAETSARAAARAALRVRFQAGGLLPATAEFVGAVARSGETQCHALLATAAASAVAHTAWVSPSSAAAARHWPMALIGTAPGGGRALFALFALFLVLYLSVRATAALSVLQLERAPGRVAVAAFLMWPLVAAAANFAILRPFPKPVVTAAVDGVYAAALAAAVAAAALSPAPRSAARQVPPASKNTVPVFPEKETALPIIYAPL